VPFKPTPGKSVFCRDCFKKNGDSGADRFGGPKSFGKFERRDSKGGSFEDRPMFEATCAKCGEKCEVPFKPNGEKPVLCKGCFAVAKGDSFSTGKSDQFAKSFGSRRPEKSNDQMEKMNAKLERILKLLEAMGQKKDSSKEAAKKEVSKESAKETVKEAPKKETAKTPAKKEVVAEKPAKAAKVAKPKKAKKAK
jgi:CxxC-x17-CxxC domain-containing protein